MKAISVKQPWASLIVRGIKDIENRTWKCPEKYIGQRVLIHASANPVLNYKPSETFSIEQYHALSLIQCKAVKKSLTDVSSIVGSVLIIACVTDRPSIWAERAKQNRMWANHEENFILEKPIYNWVLGYPVEFPQPIPAKGKLGIWDYPNILAEMEEDNGELFCHCQLPVKEQNQVMSLGGGQHYCRYCGGKWYK
ncbi:MAG: ASCH domain-containing protein [Bacteroidales bacterium]|nr:ASCH domain-containing protein [Bacteroidales bacterium]